VVAPDYLLRCTALSQTDYRLQVRDDCYLLSSKGIESRFFLFFIYVFLNILYYLPNLKSTNALAFEWRL
jgi:hypothetical protein